MSYELGILSLTAVSLGFFHTLLGPDHYLPFIMMSKARGWSFLKTSVITFLCGIGHILSSVLLGVAGLLLGMAVNKVVAIESVRGEIASWILISFGLVYFIWGMKQAARNKPHAHDHMHENGSVHAHDHSHATEHMHIHDGKKDITPWILFTILVFGPCEPLIPIIMYPAAKGSMTGLLSVTLIFGLTTIITMMGIVAVSYFGMSFVPLKKIEKYTHAFAGASIFLCGVAVQFLGL